MLFKKGKSIEEMSIEEIEKYLEEKKAKEQPSDSSQEEASEEINNKTEETPDAETSEEENVEEAEETATTTEETEINEEPTDEPEITPEASPVQQENIDLKVFKELLEKQDGVIEGLVARLKSVEDTLLSLNGKTVINEESQEEDIGMSGKGKSTANSMGSNESIFDRLARQHGGIANN